VIPVATPVTTPVAASTVAIAGVLLVQVPPVGVLDNVRVPPTHAVAVPAIAVGKALTVTVAVVIQPVGRE
jgi:hypothetical protein